MKKLFKNKKILLAMAVAGIVAASGLTYAWFRQSIVAERSSVSLGALHLNVTFEEAAEEWYYEPGRAAYTNFEIVNPATYATIPTIDAMVKLNNNVCVELLDWEGWHDLGDPDDQAPEVLGLEPITNYPNLFSTYLGVKDDATFDMATNGNVAWMLLMTTDEYNAAHGLTVPDVYLYINGGRSTEGETVAVEFESGVKFVGPVDHEGEKFYGAEFRYGCVFNETTNEWEIGDSTMVATQALENFDDDGNFVEGAAYTEWGVTLDDLTFVDFTMFGNDAAPIRGASIDTVNGITAAEAYQMVVNQVRK